MQQTVTCFESLPLVVKEYCELFHKKKQFNVAYRELGQALRSKSKELTEWMTESKIESFPFLPTSEQESEIYGGTGSVEMVVKKQYESVTLDHITRLCVEFFKFLMPDACDADITKIGWGLSRWLWSNRKRKNQSYLKRFYQNDIERPRKKRKIYTEEDKTEIVKKKTGVIPPPAVPQTREEFLGIQGLKAFLEMARSSEVEEEEDDEDEREEEEEEDI